MAGNPETPVCKETLRTAPTDVRTMDILDRLDAHARGMRGTLTGEIFTLAAEEIRRLRRMDDPPEIGPDGHEWAKTKAGYEFVDTMVPRADDHRNLMWFGWALRDAFVAGAEWQEKRPKPPPNQSPPS